MDGVPYTLCQSIHGLPSYYVHPGIVPGWMGYILYTLCQSIHRLPSYYVHPGIVPGWMGYILYTLHILVIHVYSC